MQVMQVREQIGRINVDLDQEIRRPTSWEDLIMQTGDMMIVPEFQSSVKVVGAVNSPGSVLWQPGKTLGYYIGAAVGLAQNGDGDRATVRHANGQVESRRHGFLGIGSDPKASAGATILVPSKPEDIFHDRTAIFSALAWMIASTATIFFALRK